MTANRLYIATETFITKDGESVTEGKTLLWEDDPLVRSHPQFFMLSPDHVRPEVESATREPGEKRGVRIGGATAKAKVRK